MAFTRLTDEQYNALNPDQKRAYDIEAAKEENKQAVQPQPATVLPQQPPINGSEQVTNEYSQSGNIGGNTSYGVHQQFGTQSGTSTSGLDELSPERKSELEARQRALAEANHMDYDPATGKLTPKNTFFYDVIGIDREAVKKDREREIATNRTRQSLNALRDSLMLVSDMVSAAVGGNVWKREKDPTNKELEERNRQLKAEQLQEDKDSADKLNSQYEKTVKGLSDLADRFNQLYATRTSRNTHNNTGTNVSSGASSQWTQSAQTSRQGTKHSQDWWAMQRLSKNGSQTGSDYLPIKVHTAYGEETYRLPIAEKKKESISNELANVLVKLPDYKTKYEQYITKKQSDDNPPTYSVDLDRLINDGVFLDNPNIMNTFIEELRKSGGLVDENGEPASRAQIYEMITGESIYDANGKIDASKVLQGVKINGVAGTKVAKSSPIQAPWLLVQQ